jgi:hypothetical protein
MIFNSESEDGTPKCQYLLSLKVGDEMVTRRFIKPEERCICGRTKEQHNDYSLCEIKTKEDAFATGNWILGHTFFPSCFSIGKTLCVQAKRTGGALCGCGKEKKEHTFKKLRIFETPNIKFSEPLQKTEICLCKSMLEISYDRIVKGNAYSTLFKPIRFKIIGGMWHKSWMHEMFEKSGLNKAISESPDAKRYDKYLPKHGFPTSEPEYDAEIYQRVLDARERDALAMSKKWSKNFMINDAKLEGFQTVDGWLDYYTKHKININDTWRILAKRVI